MYRLVTLCFVLICGLAACSGDLPHTAAFDPDSPADRQARATLSGRVLLENESDSSQIDVQVQNNERTYQATTAQDGSLSLTGVVPGQYRVNIATRYFEPATATVNVVLGTDVQLGIITLKPLKSAVVGKALLETLDAGATVTSGGVDLVLQKTGSIRSSTESAPARYIAAAAAAAEPVTALTYQTVSLSDGTYTLSGVSAGQYILIASASGVAPSTISIVKVTGDGTVTVEDAVLRPLTGFFTILGSADGMPNATYTQVPDLTLNMIAFNTVKMAIGRSANGTEAGCVLEPEETFSATPAVKPNFLTEGNNTVCARFFDENGNGTPLLRQSILLDTTPPVGTATLDNGSAATSDLSGQVFLSLNAADVYTGVKSMKVANLAAHASCAAALADASVSAESFTTVKSWPLDNAGANISGTRWVCAALADGAGNWSAPVSDAIQYDTLAPTGTGIAINAGAVNTNSLQVTLTLSATGATEMMLGNDGSFATSTWEPFRTTLSWSLANIQETRSVSVLFRDGAGNASLAASDTIDLDTVAPTGNIVISAANGVTNSTSSTLLLSATGADEMILSNDGTFDTETWEPFATSKANWTLEDADGLRFVHVRYRDTAGNESATSFATLTLDRTLPAGTVSMNGGAAWTNDPAGNVTLTLSAGDDRTGIAAMRVANKVSTCAADLAAVSPESFVTVKAWVLDNPGSAFGAPRTVCAAFRDGAGNWSGAIETSAGFDPEAPEVYSGGILINGGAAYAQSGQVVLALSATGATEMQIANNSSFTGAQWEPYRYETIWFLLAGEGSRSVWTRFRDAAGNTTVSYDSAIQVDITPPGSPSVVIDGGAGFTNSVDVTLTLSASAATRMQISDDGFFDTEPMTGYLVSVPWSLGGGDGAKVVAVRYLDDAGNAVIASAAIVLDTQPFGPTLTFEAQGSDVPAVAGRTKNQLVNAVFSGLTADAVEMQISNDADFIGSPWQPTAATSTWTVLPGEGQKSVFARVRNAAANESHLLTATIVLDQSGPASPGLAVSDADGDTFAIATDRVELRWTQPGEAVAFELERYILGVDTIFTPITSPAGAVETYVDYVTGTTGLVHQYRVRAFDMLGNPSPWSIIVIAYPFEPVQGVYWVKTDAGYRYQFPVNRGTFSLRPSLGYNDATGRGSVALAENVTDWLASTDPAWFNLDLTVKTSNSDNSLVYNSTVPIFGNEYTILEAANVGNEDEVGLTVDANGATHMIYGGQYFTIHYATNKSGAWVIESIGTGTANIYQVQLVADKNGKLHVVFLDMAGGNWTIAYMTNASGAWVRANLATGGGWSYYEPALAVADDGTVHIVYNNNFANLYYGTDPLGAWAPTIIDGAAMTSPGIGFDGAGTLHVLSQGGGQVLRHGINSGGGWSFTTIDTGADSGTLAVDRQGNIHTAYHTNVTNAVNYAVYSNGVWSVETLAGSGGRGPSITLDSLGAPYIAYTEGLNLRIADKSAGTWTYRTLESNPNGYRPPTLHASRAGDLSLGYIDLGIHSVKVRKIIAAATSVRQIGVTGDGGTYPKLATAPGKVLQIAYASGGLAYGTNATSAWSKQVLHAAISPVRIAMATSGDTTQIVYREGTNYHYVNNAGGVWQPPVLLTTYGGALVGASKGGAGLALSSTGQAHVVFARSGGSLTGIGYLTNPAGVWAPLRNFWTMTAGYPKEIDTKMGPDGKIRVAMSAWNGTNNNYALRYATLDPADGSSAAFVPGVVDDGNADQVALAVDAQGKNHIVYIAGFTAYSPTDDVQTGVLRYATDKSGTWVTTTLDASSAYLHPQLTLDARGVLHATFTDALSNRLKYASNLTGTWRSVYLDPAGTIGPSALIADESGTLRLAFRRSAENTVLQLEDFFGFLPAISITRSSPF